MKSKLSSSGVGEWNTVLHAFYNLQLNNCDYSNEKSKSDILSQKRVRKVIEILFTPSSASLPPLCSSAHGLLSGGAGANKR